MSPEGSRAPSRVSRLRGLPYSATEDEIIKFFSEFTLEEVYICRRDGEASPNAAFRWPSRCCRHQVDYGLRKKWSEAYALTTFRMQAELRARRTSCSLMLLRQAALWRRATRSTWAADTSSELGSAAGAAADPAAELHCELGSSNGPIQTPMLSGSLLVFHPCYCSRSARHCTIICLAGHARPLTNPNS
jgi:hypothetical protein